MFFSGLDWVMLIQGKHKFCLNNHEIWGKICRLTFHYAQGLLWNLHLALIPKFKHIGYKSPKNNPIKPFQFCLCVLSLLLASSFFLGLVIQKSATTATSKQQEIEMVCLGIKYYRGALKWLNTLPLCCGKWERNGTNNRRKTKPFLLSEDV